MKRQMTQLRAMINPLIVVLTLLLLTETADAGLIYLIDETGNDSVFVTDGVGTEFELRLMVDDDVVGFGAYQVDINFDKFILDTVEINDDSSLFRNLGGMIIFSKYLRVDSTILRIQSMLIGAGLSVDGPGLLATIRLKAMGSGVTHLNFDMVHVAGPEGDIDVNDEGIVAILNVPPDSFNLLSPPSEEDIFLPLGDSIQLAWAPSSSIYPGDYVLYKVSIGTDPNFAPEQTSTYLAYTDTLIFIPETDLVSAWYYWKVKALSLYGFETWSNQTDWYFDLSIATYPEGFSLISPPNGNDTLLLYTEDLRFEWESSSTANPGDSILYDFHYSSHNGFLPQYTHILPNLTDTFAVVPACSLMVADRYYWKVKAHNTLGYVTWCEQSYWDFFVTVAANPGIFNLLEPVDNAQYNLNWGGGIRLMWSQSESTIPNDTITYTIYTGPNDNLPVSAVFDTSIIEALEITLVEDRLTRREWHYWRVKAINKFGFDTLSTNTYSFLAYYRGDTNGDDIINIFDVTYLISYLYMDGPAPYPLVSGDPNCDNIENIFDVTYLISFLYMDGPPPCND